MNIKTFTGIITIICAAFLPPLLATKPHDPLFVNSPNGTINLVLHINNHHDAQTNNSNTNSSYQTSKYSATADASLLKALEKGLISLACLHETGPNFIRANKWYLIGISALGGYAFITYIIMSGNNFLNDQNLWSSWKQELSLEQLLSIPTDQCTKELITEIQRRYTDASSIADLIKPLATFLNKIDQEEAHLRWYQSAYSWLSYARLSKLVPLNQQRFLMISERLQRVAYYKNLFKSWTAEYQMQQAHRGTSGS